MCILRVRGLERVCAGSICACVRARRRRHACASCVHVPGQGTHVRSRADHSTPLHAALTHPQPACSQHLCPLTPHPCPPAILHPSTHAPPPLAHAADSGGGGGSQREHGGVGGGGRGEAPGPQGPGAPAGPAAPGGPQRRGPLHEVPAALKVRFPLPPPPLWACF